MGETFTRRGAKAKITSEGRNIVSVDRACGGHANVPAGMRDRHEDETEIQQCTVDGSHTEGLH